MEHLCAFYFSGTGNTRHIAKFLTQRLSSRFETELFDVASPISDGALQKADVVLLAFPIYGSAPPIPMREFVARFRSHWAGKRVIIAETQYFFSGDGAASLGRTLEHYGARVIAAEHFNMPNNLADCKIFPIRNGEAAQKKVRRAEKRASAFAERILGGKKRRRGFHTASHAVGYYCQRKYWRKNEEKKRTQLKIDPTRCVGCGACVEKCPVANLKKENGKTVAIGKCVLCYRCVNLCPKSAITLFGSAPPAVRYKGIEH